MSSPAAGGSTSDSSSARRGAPPPYSEGGQPDRAGAPAPAAGCCASSSPPASSEQAQAVVVGVTSGDARVEAGFRAYIAAANAAGGVGGRPVRVVAAGSQQSASGSSVTVNLGSKHLAGWSGGPLLETLAVPEARLTGTTFSVASVVEHQARLAVDEVFPNTSSGRTAVIYTSSGTPWADRVPDAYESVLRSRAVAVTRVVYDAGSPAFTPADAAFLSLDPEATSRWLRDARAVGYSPSQGVTGIYPLHDAQLTSTAPMLTRVLSPYRFPVGDEAAALASVVDHLDARAVHGWATAKHLAVALWRSGAQTERQTADALRAMDGYDGRIAPPYDTRPGTTSRRPDALLHRLEGGDFIASGDFRTDPR